MQNDAPLNGKNIINHQEGCQCVESLSIKMNKNHVRCVGLMTITDPKGNCVKGLHTVMQSKVIGSKPTTGLVVFNFCPFCGRSLMKGGTDETQEISNQN